MRLNQRICALSPTNATAEEVSRITKALAEGNALYQVVYDSVQVALWHNFQTGPDYTSLRTLQRIKRIESSWGNLPSGLPNPKKINLQRPYSTLPAFYALTHQSLYPLGHDFHLQYPQTPPWSLTLDTITFLPTIPISTDRQQVATLSCLWTVHFRKGEVWGNLSITDLTFTPNCPIDQIQCLLLTLNKCQPT